MNTQQTIAKTDWRTEWFELDDVAYMNTPGQSAISGRGSRCAGRDRMEKISAQDAGGRVQFALDRPRARKARGNDRRGADGNRADYRSKHRNGGGCQRL